MDSKNIVSMPFDLVFFYLAILSVWILMWLFKVFKNIEWIAKMFSLWVLILSVKNFFTYSSDIKETVLKRSGKILFHNFLTGKNIDIITNQLVVVTTFPPASS